MLRNRKKSTAIIIALLCMAVTLTNSVFAAGTQILSPSAENLQVGGRGCGDTADGVVLGLGVATLFGCGACGIMAAGIKVAALLYC